jgi:hypothetical protein
LFLSRISKVQTTLTLQLIGARILQVHSSPICWIMAFVARLYIKPPTLTPAAAMPCARDLRVENNYGMIPAKPIMKKPMPQSKQRPWERKRCQIFVAKEALISAAVWRRTPMARVVRVEQIRVMVVMSGDRRGD